MQTDAQWFKALVGAARWLLDDLGDAEEDRNPETGEEYDSVRNLRQLLENIQQPNPNHEYLIGIRCPNPDCPAPYSKFIITAEVALVVTDDDVRCDCDGEWREDASITCACGQEGTISRFRWASKVNSAA